MIAILYNKKSFETHNPFDSWHVLYAVKLQAQLKLRSSNNFLVIRGFNIATSVYTTRLLIDPNGRTGINVAAPVAQLDVQPYTATVNPLLLHNNTGTSIFSVLNNSNVD